MLSNQLAWASFKSPKCCFLLYIGMKVVKEGGQGPEGQELREERKKNKIEEETRSKRYRIVTAIIPYFVSCSAFFVRPPISFYF